MNLFDVLFAKKIGGGASEWYSATANLFSGLTLPDTTSQYEYVGLLKFDFGAYTNVVIPVVIGTVESTCRIMGGGVASAALASVLLGEKIGSTLTLESAGIIQNGAYNDVTAAFAANATNFVLVYTKANLD